MRAAIASPCLALTVAVLAAEAALAQQVPPGFPSVHLTSTTPTGGTPGTTAEVAVIGSDLEDLTTLWFSHPGIKAELMPASPPEKGKPAPPPRFNVTIPADIESGTYDVRVAGKWGLSNPRSFVVSRLPNLAEREPNNDVPQAQKVELNTAVTGVVSANTDVDYYRIEGKKGTHVVVHCASSSIDSKLTPMVELFDARDRRLAGNRQYRDRDAVLSLTLPEDGTYTIRVCEFAYQAANNDYFYRLRVSTGPWIDAVFPPVVEGGKAGKVTLFGRNLPGGQVKDALERLEVSLTGDPARLRKLDFTGQLGGECLGLDGFQYRVKGDAAQSNPVLVTYARAPLVIDNEDNDAPEKPQNIVLPSEVCGRVEKRGDRDRYRFEARKGDVFIVEGFADRLGSPFDMYLDVRRADTGDVVAEFDDSPDNPVAFGKFFTRSDDPKGRLVIPADGEYDLQVVSRTGETRGGPRHVYRVSITREEPDYRLTVVNNSDLTGGGWTLRRGGNMELQVVCQRLGGFVGEVVLTAEGLPDKVACVPQVMAPNQKLASLVLTAADDAPDWVGSFGVTGSARIGDAEATRQARAGCIVWPTTQQNVPAMSRLCRGLCLAVRDPGPFTLGVPVRELTVPPGKQATVRVMVNRRWADFKGAVQLTRLAAPPQPNGQPIAIPNVQIPASATSAEVKFTVPANTPPGTYNLVLAGTATLPITKTGQKNKVNAGFREPAPPIRLQVFNAAAEVAVEKPLVVLKPGAEQKLEVKVKRLGSFQGELTLELVSTKSVQGVSAEPVKVGANTDAGTLTVKAAAGAGLGVSKDVLVRASAKVGDQTITAAAPIKIAVTEDGTYEDVEPKAVPVVAASGDGWRYEAASKVQGDKWRLADFNDGGWKKGKAPLGYGEEEIAGRKGTQILETGQPVLFRRVIDLPAEVGGRKDVTYSLRVASDNSAVVYVNGEKVDEDPEADHEFKYWNREVDVPVKLLKPGKNVVAVVVRNSDGSSDLFFDLEFIAQVPGGKKNDLDAPRSSGLRGFLTDSPRRRTPRRRPGMGAGSVPAQSLTECEKVDQRFKPTPSTTSQAGHSIPRFGVHSSPGTVGWIDTESLAHRLLVLPPPRDHAST